jgi:NAD(P)-dependent dehydrogenase (short-subunit alcohol dehydrogenase family)
MTQPDAKTVFLVSGGAKGITALCVMKLAKRYRCRFILAGRSAIVPEPDWAKNVNDEAQLKRNALEYCKTTGKSPTPKLIQNMVRQVLSSREITETLQVVHHAGGLAEYISVDVTDFSALKNAVEEAESRLGAVTGCIHGAGVLADKLIQFKSADDVDKVIGVKLHGLRNMLDVIPPGRMVYVVLFSSVAAYYGNVGQSDYATANEILNKVAFQIRYRHPECRVIALDWGPWDGGMVTPAIKAMLVERNVDIIPVETGTDIFVDSLVSDSVDTQVVVGGEMVKPSVELGPILRQHRLYRHLTLDDNPFLHDHVIGGYAVLPTVCAVAWVTNACEQLYPGFTFYCVNDYRALKGIVFDDSLADWYLLSLEETEKSAEDGITLDAMISSETPDGRPRFHYKMQVTIRRDIPQAPIYPDIELDESLDIAGEKLYRDNILFHGPRFRGINRVLNLADDKLTMECNIPNVSLADQGQFQVQTFNPFVTDVQLQSLLIWAKHTYGYGGLPLRIARGIQYREIPEDILTIASLKVTKASKRSLVADVTVHDRDGVVYSKVTGAEITLSERLNVLFQQNQLI